MIRCKSKRFLAVLLSVLVIFELMATVLFSTSADDANTKTITKNLVDLSNSQVAVDIEDSQWPAGIVKMTADDTYAYNSNATVDIAEDIDGEKFLKFNFDQAKQVGNNDYIAERTSGHKFFVKVSVPVNYIPYLKDFKVDMLYNYKQASGSTTDKKKQAYYVLGVKDGVAWGKDVRSHYSIAPTNAATVDEQKTVKFSEIKKLTSNVSLQSYLKNTTGYVEAPTYTTTDLENASSMEILVMFSAPEITAAMRNRGYFFGIKNISITLEGPADRIDNIDKPATIDPSIVNFEEGNTLAEITAATGFNPQPRGELVTEGAHSGTNAYLYRRKQGTSGVDYDTRVGVKIDKKKSQHSQGVTFMYKNISDVKVNFRLWFAVGNAAEGTNDAKIGKYHYQFEAPAGMTEYQRVTVYWNNIGLTDYTHGGFSGGSSSGHAIPQSDINSGINIKIIQNGLSIDDAGVLFDTFEAVTDEFIAARNLSLVDFENCDEGVNDLPEGVSIAGDYKGSYEIVKTGDKKALRVNYDLPGTAKTESSSQWHQLINRHTFEFNIQIPKKILKDVQQIAYIVKTNAPAHSDDKGTNTYYQTILKGYDISFKSGESARIFTQNRNVTASVTISPNSSSTYGYTASHYAYNWLNKNNAIAMTEEYLEELTTVSLYVAVPICNGTEGYWFELDDIILEFAEPPVNQETLARDIFTSKNNEAVVGSTITVENKPVSVSDPNHSEFENSYLIKTKAGNTEFVKFNND